MVQVIKVAKKQVECKRCNSILEYDHSEVRTFKVSYDYLGDYEVKTGIKCPVCKFIVETNR